MIYLSIFRSLFSFFKEWFNYFAAFLSLFFKSTNDIKLENIALRSQLIQYRQRYEKQKLPKPQPTPAFRQLWVILSKSLTNWKSLLIVVQPKTVIKWHRTAFKLHWKRKSKKIGRPKISEETINLIKQVHQENPLLSPEKIHEKLRLLGIKKPPAPNTIAKYVPSTRKPPTERQIQSWKTFLKNHQSVTWATDFLTMPTLTFGVLYVLIIIDHQTRKIVSFGVTTNPTAQWTVQQFRNATPFGVVPKYLVHDNDPIFRSEAFQRFLSSSGIISKRTAYRSPWQNPYAERVIGTIKRELLDHIIPINQLHLRKLLHEYINDYYNTNRTHQGLMGKTPVASRTYLPTSIAETKLEATPVLNGLYHTYKKIA